MNTFNLKVIASNKVFYDGPCQRLTIPLEDGEKGFLAHHENVVMSIFQGEMRITTPDDEVIEGFVGSGFIEFEDNVATLLCISAERPGEIDERRAEEARIRAEEELRQANSDREYLHSQANLARAMERLKVKKHHNNY